MSVIFRPTGEECMSRAAAMRLHPLTHISNAAWSDYEAAGWRDVVPFACPEGYALKGNRRVESVGDEEHEVWDIWTFEEQASYIAAQAAAAEAERLARLEEPVIIDPDRPLQTPGLEIRAGEHVFFITVDPSNPLGLLVLQRESKRKSNAEVTALVQAETTRRAAIKASWNGNGQVQSRLEVIERLLGLRA